MKNEMKLIVPSISANESFVRVAVAAFAARLDPTIEEINDIKTAVSEAVTNSIVHAYKNEVGKIYITVTADEDCTAMVITAPKISATNLFFVMLFKYLSILPLDDFSKPSDITFIPYKKNASPPTNLMTE